ncbi:MAG: restriction endonuclease subunit S [Saprospiraceae bacterium]|nr:restriction endonuclease subunit S [Saprospiraceae bacterium]
MSTVRPNLRGFTFIKNQVKDLIASTGFAVITTKMCINEFLFQYLFSSGIDRQFHQLLVGSNYPAINSSDVRKLTIPLPPLPEQKAIASVLSTWDDAIYKTEQLITQKELRKKWLMQNLLTGKKRLKGFDGEWKEFKIEQLFEEIDRFVKWDENELYNLISVRRRNGGLFWREPLHGNKIGVKKLKEIYVDDFLISKRQVSHGAWDIVTEEFNKGKVSDEYDCLKIKSVSVLDSGFWIWYCKLPVLTHYAYIDSLGVHIEKSIFSFRQFKKRKVKIPASIDEQTAIAQVLQAADKEITLLRAKADKLREQKKGLMQILLTGKKRLNYDSFDTFDDRVSSINHTNHLNHINHSKDRRNDGSK